MYQSLFRHQEVLFFWDFLIAKDGTDTLSQNVSKGSPFDAVQYPRRAPILATLRQNPEIRVTHVARWCFWGTGGILLTLVLKMAKLNTGSIV
jgi:hypothetical protein